MEASDLYFDNKKHTLGEKFPRIPINKLKEWGVVSCSEKEWNDFVTGKTSVLGYMTHNLTNVRAKELGLIV